MDELSYVFTIFFLTLGSVKVMAPFVMLTREMPQRTKYALAFRASVIATLVGLFIVFVGNNTREKWGIAPSDLMVAGGILLLTSALGALNPRGNKAAVEESDNHKVLALSPLAFPVIITPYGIVALLLFASIAGSSNDFLIGVFGIFVAIMVADFFAMIFAAPIIGFIGTQPLMAIGWVFAVLQASLAVHAIVMGLRTGLLAPVIVSPIG